MASTSRSPMRSRNPVASSETTGFSPPTRRPRSGYETERSRLPMARLRRRRSNSPVTFSLTPKIATRGSRLRRRSRQLALEVSRSDRFGKYQRVRLRHMETLLPPIEKPKGLTMKLAYYLTRRQFGKVLKPLKVHRARLPLAFALFYTKIGKLDKMLTLPPETVLFIREQVARINICLFCMDIARSF